MGKKLSRFAIWCLGALLMVASIDSIPDPPAVSSHSAKSFASQLQQVPCNPAEKRLDCDTLQSSSFPVQVRWITLASVAKPTLPSDWGFLSGHATDPSPPARTLNFLS